MRSFISAIFTLMLVGCGTTSKKLIDLPPLANNAPVQIFWGEPNVKYDKVCEIEAVGNNSLGGGYRKKEDFEGMFKKEARKCGADGVVFKFLTGYQQGKVTAYATGIKVTGQAAGLTDTDKVKAFSLAIQSHDLSKVKVLISGVAKKQSERAPSDDELINLGLYIATLDGMSCDKKIVNLLENEYEGRVPKFRAVNFYAAGKSDSNTPLCNDVIARSLPKMQDKSMAIVEINNHYIGLLNNTYDPKLNEKAAKYRKVLAVAANMIADACKQSETDPICATKGAYLDFANKTKNAKLSAVKINAQEILKILK